MIALLAVQAMTELVALAVLLGLGLVWALVQLVRSDSNRAENVDGDGEPLNWYDVVYPNGLRKSVTARSPKEAAEIVAGDTNLKHDVVLYTDEGRIAAVVRPRPDGMKWACFSD